MRVAGNQEILFITCPSLEIAESLADLIDGYYRLHFGSDSSIWNRKGMYTQKKRDELVLVKSYLQATVWKQFPCPCKGWCALIY